MRNIKVLVVEDEALVACSLAALLEEAGYHVVGPSASGRQAVALATETAPQIALVDMNLADGRTGPGVAQFLADRFGTVAIAVTANPEGLHEGTGGIARILGKPYAEETVLDLVEWAVMRLPRHRGAGRRASAPDGGHPDLR